MGQLGDALRGPLQRRISEVGLQRDVAAKLHLVAEANLRACLDEGVHAVALVAGVDVAEVILRLPGDALDVVATEAGRAHTRAVEVVTGNQSGWASTLEDLAGVGLDVVLEEKLGLGGLGIGRSLFNLVGGKVRETRLGEAIAQLAVKLNAFEALVEQTAAQLDTDPELAQALAKKNAFDSERADASTKKAEVGTGCLLLFLLGCVGGVGALGYLGWRGWTWAFNPVASPPPAQVSGTTPPKRPASPLVGEWTSSSGESLQAVEIDDAVEFTISRPGPWADQGYVEGEMRFRLRPLDNATDVIGVEDKTRPAMPKGVKFAPEAAESCHVIRSAVAGTPLRAHATADRLVIESVRTVLPPAAFRWRNQAVTGCAMDRASESKVEVVLSRSVPTAPGSSMSTGDAATSSPQ